VCCSTLQCVAVCCSVLQYVAVRCSVSISEARCVAMILAGKWFVCRCGVPSGASTCHTQHITPTNTSHDMSHVQYVGLPTNHGAHLFDAVLPNSINTCCSNGVPHRYLSRGINMKTLQRAILLQKSLLQKSPSFAKEPFFCKKALLLQKSPSFANEPFCCKKALLLHKSSSFAKEPFFCKRALVLQQKGSFA